MANTSQKAKIFKDTIKKEYKTWLIFEFILSMNAEKNIKYKFSKRIDKLVARTFNWAKFIEGKKLIKIPEHPCFGFL